MTFANSEEVGWSSTPGTLCETRPLQKAPYGPISLSSSNPGFAVVFYCGAKLLAATLVSRFLTSTYQAIRLRPEIGPTSCFAKHFDTSPRTQQQNQGCSQSLKYRKVFLRLRFVAFRDLGPYSTFYRGLDTSCRCRDPENKFSGPPRKGIWG